MKRKKGSSLITVIIFMMFLMIVGAATITMTMMDYKARVNESKRIEHLYGAESGLEIAYDILVKASDYAINQAVEVTNKQFTLDKTKSATERVNLDDLFKKTYLRVLFDEMYQHQLVSNQKLPGGLVPYLLKDLTYPIINEQSKLIFESSGFNPIDKNITIEVELLDSDNEEIIDLNEIRETFQVRVTSSFESKEENSYVHKNERKVSRTFEFNVPNYTQALVDLYPVFNGKALTVDGNVLLTGLSSAKSKLDIIGDVWVGGDICANQDNTCSDAITDVTYQKYSRGILLEDAELVVSGNLATKETVALRNKANVTMIGNLYGRNIYIGRKELAAESTDSHFTAISDNETKYEVVLSNDLAVNSDSTVFSTMEIDKFYGITDGNILDRDVALDNVDLLSKESSSILVNASGASIDIREEALIAGLAFIDVTDGEGNKYQTGESVAIKPNYLAYTMVVDDLVENITFRYYNPLMLVETIDGKSKSDYFVQVSEDGLLSMSDGGVRLPAKLYTAGASVSNQGVLGAKGTAEGMAAIKNLKTTDYIKYVQQMNGLEDTKFEQRTVANQIKWDASGFSQSVINSSLGSIILNSKALNDVLIIEENGHHFVQIGSGERQKISDHLFLITKGKLKLKGNINLTGNIIVGGHVEADSSTANGVMTYDEEFMKTILANNSDLFNDIFIDSGKVITSISSTEDEDYNATTIITKGRWQLVK
ncbi:MAG: pilus assembly PilX N-terminal domain-containing protein [Turicibacter sp.]|nr:pilus assembly PilX N-terminal domain-containing protein [Turicibacter sp.]